MAAFLIPVVSAILLGIVLIGGFVGLVIAPWQLKFALLVLVLGFTQSAVKRSESTPEESSNSASSATPSSTTLQPTSAGQPKPIESQASPNPSSLQELRRPERGQLWQLDKERLLNLPHSSRELRYRGNKLAQAPETETTTELTSESLATPAIAPYKKSQQEVVSLGSLKNKLFPAKPTVPPDLAADLPQDLSKDA